MELLSAQVEIYEITRPDSFTYRVEYSTVDNPNRVLDIDIEKLAAWVVRNGLNEVTHIDEVLAFDQYVVTEANYYEFIQEFLNEKHA